MDQILSQLRQMARGMWHYRWWGLAVTWIVGLGGAAYVMTLPNRYEATARVYVDTQSILKPLLSGLAVQPNTEQQVALLSRTLLARPTLEKLVRMTDLDAGVGDRSEVDRLIDNLATDIRITSTGRDNLYTLSFRHTDRDRAQKLVQSLVSSFVESGLGRTRSDSAQAKKFIDEQIKAYEAKLLDAETRLKEFRLKNLDSSNPDGKDANARLSAALEQYDTARLELREARNARDEARRQMQDMRRSQVPMDSRLPDPPPTASIMEMDARIDTQRKMLESLLLRYTEEHPDVVNARMLLRAMEDQRRREASELRRAAASQGGTVAAPSNPALQELARLLASSEVQVASLRARVEEYEAKVARARKLLKVSPEIEAQAVALNRDYALNKKSYEDLLARRQSAELTGELDEATGLAEFRVIDPPRVSPKPVSPNRLMLTISVLLIAIVAGCGTAFLLFEIRPVFHTGREVAAKLRLPLLGVVGLVPTRENLRAVRNGYMRFYALVGSFLAVYAMGLVGIVLAGRSLG